MKCVLNQLSIQDYEILHNVLGVVNDKGLENILPMFPKNAIYYFCRPNIPRGLDAVELESKGGVFGLQGNSYNTVQSALNAAKISAGNKDLIFVGGSTFVVAEVV